MIRATYKRHSLFQIRDTVLKFVPELLVEAFFFRKRFFINLQISMNAQILDQTIVVPWLRATILLDLMSASVLMVMRGMAKTAQVILRYNGLLLF